MAGVKRFQWRIVSQLHWVRCYCFLFVSVLLMLAASRCFTLCIQMITFCVDIEKIACKVGLGDNVGKCITTPLSSHSGTTF